MKIQTVNNKCYISEVEVNPVTEYQSQLYRFYNHSSTLKVLDAFIRDGKFWIISNGIKELKHGQEVTDFELVDTENWINYGNQNTMVATPMFHERRKEGKIKAKLL